MRWQAAPSAAPGISVIDLTYAQVLPDLNLLSQRTDRRFFSGVGCAHIGENPDVVADRKRLCLD